MCYILDAILIPDNDADISEKTLGLLSYTDTVTPNVEVTSEMEAIFISAIYSSLGAPLEGNSRLVFDEFVKKISGLVKIADTPSKPATFSKL